jgi:hypothetical protein
MKRIALSLLFLFASCRIVFGQGAAVTMVKDVHTIAEMQALNVLSPHTAVSVKGYFTVDDGGGGKFDYVSNSVAVADNGIVFAPNVGAGRYIRQHDKGHYEALWWGTVKTNAPIQAAIDFAEGAGGGRVRVSGGQWMVKCDDSTRLLMRSGVWLETADDSQIVCAPFPTNSWIMIDFPLDVINCGVGPARLVGWNLAAPGGDTNATGVIFSLQDTTDVTIGGVRASNWYSEYADIGSNNINLQMFDDQWLTGARAFGATGLGYPNDDTRALQSYVHYAERYGGDVYLRATTNGFYFTSVYATNGVPIRFRGDKTLCTIYYYNPDEGVVPRYSSAFTISADNSSVSSLKFAQLGAFPITETNSQTTGFFIPVNIHLATNVVVENCEFDIPTGKGIINSGSYTKIINNLFDHCGLTFGNGHRQDWLFYEAAVPFKGATSYSPSSGYISGNTFIGGSPYKHTLFSSGADDPIIEGNKLLEMNSPNPISVYTGDEGITDILGTNIYRFSGKVLNNTITGTNFGSDGAIVIKMATTTNFVQAGFNPTNMYSAVIVEGNHINGVGPGITLINGKGTILRGNDIKTASSPVWPLGDSTGMLIEGGKLETTNRGIAGITIPFGDSFYGIANFKNVVIRNVEITSAPGDEIALRNVEPAKTDNFTAEGNTFHFNGAAGSADYPQVFQWTASTNGLRFVRNDIYIGSSMHGRRIGQIINSNSFTKFDRNSVIASDPSIARRGPYLKGARVFASDNDVGSLELQNVDIGIVTRNYITSPTNAYIALEVHNSGHVVVEHNTIETFYAPSSVAASIGATNGTFYGNIVKGDSGGYLVDFPLGKIYEGDNLIINPNPAGPLYPTGTSPGTLAHSIFERPISIVSSEAANVPTATFRRSSNVLKLVQDNWFTGSTRDAQWRSEPTVTSDLAGVAWFAWNGTTNEYGFGLQGGVPLLFQIGTLTNTVSVEIHSVAGTNAIVWLDNNAQLNKLTIGTGLTNNSGTLSVTSSGGETSGTVHSGGSLTTDNAIARVDGTGGTNVQSSVVIVGDTGVVTGVNTLTATNAITASEFTAGATNLVASQALKAPLASPVFTGDPTVPNVVLSDSDTTVANTGFVKSNITAVAKRQLKFNFPRRIDGTGCTYPNTNDFTLTTFMVPRFSGTTVSNSNWCRFAVRAPKDIDTSVALTASLTVRLTTADTAAQIYNVGFASVANSAVSIATVGTWIKLDIAADASGASDDVESVSNVALTGWAAGLTANQWWVIELNRAGAADASTVASDFLELQIEYQVTQ